MPNKLRLIRISGLVLLVILILRITWFKRERRIQSDSKRLTRNQIDQYKRQCDELSASYNLLSLPLKPEICAQFQVYCGISKCESMIDVVYLWVNGSDPKFRSSLEENYHRFKDNPSYEVPKSLKDGESRYRELNQFLYSLRSLEKNFAYARRIFIVTNGQVPSFLNLDNLQIRIVTHDELKPNNRPYPLFNSMAIQSMIHTIPTLSSPFFYCEDDMFFGNRIPLSRIFDKGKAVTGTRAEITLENIQKLSKHNDESPKDGEKTIIPNSFITGLRNSLELAKSKKYNTKAFISNGKLYYNSHISLLLFKEVYVKMWNDFPEELSKMASHTFRHWQDPHFWTLYLFADGEGIYNTYSRNHYDIYFNMLTDNRYHGIFKQLWEYPVKPLFVCLNDDFENYTNTIYKDLQYYYSRIFPEKSKFEK